VILVIDNYDSFTYNLVQYIGELDAECIVFRNDKITVDEIAKLSPERIVISPGPGTPDDAGISMQVIREFGPGIPVLGVCLGHQSIGQVYGGTVTRAEKVMHGKTSIIYHTGEGIFQDVSNPFEATRYHSLVVSSKGLPPVLVRTAWTEDQVIMGLKHREYPVWGVQFHPESILTGEGKKLLKNFLAL
jgi:anthranilate synthase/aminodeoxychorismate synthase-like glutamine amidotransferase